MTTRVEVLHVPGCPNAVVLADRLDAVLRGGDVRIERHVVHDQAEAVALRMAGSPTLLVDGVDPFEVAGQAASVSCRLYVSDDGALTGAPSPAQLRSAVDGLRFSGQRRRPWRATA